MVGMAIHSSILPRKSYGQGNLIDGLQSMGLQKSWTRLSTKQQQGQLSAAEAGTGCAGHPRMGHGSGALFPSQ